MTGLSIPLSRLMLVGAHPDDEIIGAGGLIHRAAREGGQVSVVTLTCGETAAASEAEARPMGDRRREEMRAADAALGVAARHVLAIPSQQAYRAAYGDNQLHHELIRLIREFRPQVLLAHRADSHRDHCAVAEAAPQAAFQAGEAILAALGEPWRTAMVLHYAVEQTLDEPEIAVRISAEDVEAKVNALRTQVSQARNGYLERLEQMVRGRAGFWGARCFGAGQYGEAFQLSRGYPLVVA
jgi:LmbE family N-acetylglucosaminyl deacetylase